MENIIIVAILILILGCAVCYIYKAKKKGKKCIGCPYGESCNQKKYCGVCGYNSWEK